MLYNRFQEILSHFGFQMREKKSAEGWQDQIGKGQSYVVLNEEKLQWSIPQEFAENNLKEVKKYQFGLGDFNESSQSFENAKVYELPLKYESYAELERIVHFLLSGFVSAFSIGQHQYIFNPVVARLNSALRETSDDNRICVEDLEKEIEKFSDDAILNNYLAKIYVELGDLQKAAIHFTDAGKANPSYGEAFSNLGAIMWQIGKKEEAFHLFSEALLRVPFNVDVQDNFIKTGLDLSALNQMKEKLVEVERLYPDYYDLLYLKAVLNFRLGCSDAAENDLKKLLNHNQENEKARALLEDIRQMTGGVSHG